MNQSRSKLRARSIKLFAYSNCVFARPADERSGSFTAVVTMSRVIALLTLALGSAQLRRRAVEPDHSAAGRRRPAVPRVGQRPRQGDGGARRTPNSRRHRRAARRRRQHRHRTRRPTWSVRSRSLTCRQAAMCCVPCVRASPTPSAPFHVRPGETEQVLVEMRLTFVRESVDVVVPANSPTESLQPVAVSDVLTGAKMDIQPLAGDDFQSLLTVLPSIIRGPEGRLRIKGGAPDDRRAADEQREPQRSVDGRFRSRAAQRRGRIGRSALQPIRRRVRPLLDQRDAGAHQARHQRLVVQARQPRPRLRQGLRVRQQVRAAALDLRAAQEGPAAVRRVPSVSVRADAGEEPAGRDRSSGSTASTRSRGSTPCSRRATRSPAASSISRARSPTRRSRPSVRRRRRRSSPSPDSRRAPPIGSSCRRNAVLESTLAARTFEVDQKTAGRRSRWSTRRRPRAATSSTGRNATSIACSSSRR